MKVTTLRRMADYLKCNSGFSEETVNSTITALGYDPIHATQNDFIEISRTLIECAEHGADSGFSGFIYYNDTIAFYKKNQQDIVKHMEQTAADFGTDIITMVQEFGVFRHGDKPTTSQVGRALYDSGQTREDLTSLYNVFSWYTLEEISRTWRCFLEDNWDLAAELSA
jgi:hypothetical protein